MSRLAIVTRPGLALGFRIAGAATEVARNPAEAERAVRALLGSGGVAVLAIDEDLLAGLGRPTRRGLDDGGVVCVALPPAFARPAEGST